MAVAAAKSVIYDFGEGVGKFGKLIKTYDKNSFKVIGAALDWSVMLELLPYENTAKKFTITVLQGLDLRSLVSGGFKLIELLTKYFFPKEGDDINEIKKEIIEPFFYFPWNLYKGFKTMRVNEIFDFSDKIFNPVKVIGGMSFANISVMKIADAIENLGKDIDAEDKRKNSLNYCILANYISKFAIGVITSLKVFFIIALPSYIFLALGTIVIATDILYLCLDDDTKKQALKELGKQVKKLKAPQINELTNQATGMRKVV